LQARWDDFRSQAWDLPCEAAESIALGRSPSPRGVEIRALRQLQREGPTSGDSVFCSERGGSLTIRGVQKMVERLAERCRLGGLNIHPTCCATVAAITWQNGAPISA
jgi:hypothetical protein